MHQHCLRQVSSRGSRAFRGSYLQFYKNTYPLQSSKENSKHHTLLWITRCLLLGSSQNELIFLLKGLSPRLPVFSWQLICSRGPSQLWYVWTLLGPTVGGGQFAFSAYDSVPYILTDENRDTREEEILLHTWSLHTESPRLLRCFIFRQFILQRWKLKTQ